MTKLDDDRLASLFARAGLAFEVPATGPDDIVARAAGRVATAPDGDGEGGDGETPLSGGGAPTGRMRRLAGVTGRHRLLSVAAGIAVLLVLAGGIAALVRSPAHPALTAASPHTSLTAPAAAPSTTTTAPGALSSRGERRKPRTPPPPGPHSARRTVRRPLR